MQIQIQNIKYLEVNSELSEDIPLLKGSNHYKYEHVMCQEEQI